MNPALVFNIAELALSLAKSQLPGKTQHDVPVADTLLDIVRKGAQAYQQHTGEPLNPLLIRAEEPLQKP